MTTVGLAHHTPAFAFQPRTRDDPPSPSPFNVWAAITGAQVTVTYFMPAMPAMGMAAMRTQVSLAEKGNGLYEGAGQLDSGGTWQVTIVAKKNGQIVASKQLSVNATGGM